MQQRKFGEESRSTAERVVRIEKSVPPLHDGCDCYLVEDRINKEVDMQSVEEGKARLIAKRISARIAEGPILGKAWEELNPETRESVVNELGKIASEVLGEEVEPPAWDKFLAKVCNEQGYGVVMEMLAYYWQIDKGNEARTIGPHRDLLVECDCEEGESCEWCCGTHMLTHRVKRAMEEADRPKEEKETHEKYGGNPQVWSQFVFHTGWTEGFVDRMRERGAVKVVVPVSPTGSIAVEFPKLSEVTSGMLRLTQDERDMIVKELDSIRDEKKPKTGQ